jgi:hypothetical protein
MTKLFESMGGRKASKAFVQFTSFIDIIRNGKRAVMFGQDYVVLDKTTYEDLRTRAEAYTHIQEAKKVAENKQVDVFGG